MPLFRSLFLFLWVILLFSCAKQGFPPGGPVDKTAPRIVQTFPKPDTTQVALNSTVEILFSEPVQRRSCEESIFITPLPADGVIYQWKGSRLIIQFPKGLAAQRTYVITIGTDCKDRRNNAMASSFSLAFSTGDHLDQGSIQGQLFSDSPLKDVQVWAFDLQENPDPDPSRTAPLYITQPDAQGRFHLRYLSLSQFRVFAVQDRDHNGRYGAQSEAIGVASRDVLLTADRPSQTDLFLQMAVMDTTAPRLVAAFAPNLRQVDLQFSEKMAQVGQLTIAAGEDTLRVLSSFLDGQNPILLRARTADQTAERTYTLSLAQGCDPSGRCIDSLQQIPFKGSGRPDTVRPRYVSMMPRDSSRTVPWDALFHIRFSKAMDEKSLRDHFSMHDTSRSQVDGELSFPDPTHLQFRPFKPLAENRLYYITLPVDSIKDASGNRLADTLFVKKIKTVAADTLSEISGTIADQDRSAKGDILVQARSLEGNHYLQHLPGPGPYRFENILPGSYLLYVFRDQDGNGQFSRGVPFPFQPAERFIHYPDTLTVRARWPNQGNDVQLPAP
ncbi:MAG TPA: Ig-like domain-containing protein [bacterium]|nr:Ig-like domain-containing protein [bacterium]